MDHDFLNVLLHILLILFIAFPVCGSVYRKGYRDGYSDCLDEYGVIQDETVYDPDNVSMDDVIKGNDDKDNAE